MIIYECGKIIYILWAQKYINYNVLLFIIYFFAVVILLYWNFLLQIASIYSVLLCIQMHEILDGPVKATLPPFLYPLYFEFFYNSWCNSQSQT